MDAPIQTCVRRLRWVALLLALFSVGVDTPVVAATNATDQFYDPELVQSVHLKINPEDLERMHQALPRRICGHADVEPGKTYRYRVYAVLPTPQGSRGTGHSNVITISIPEK